MQREVIKWLQSLDLTYPVKNPRRDFSNGFSAAEILSRYVGPNYISMAGITNGTSSTVRRSNWDQVYAALQRLGCRTITADAVENVIQFNANAALNVLEHMYEFLTKKPLLMRTVDAGGANSFLRSKDAKSVNAFLEMVGEVPLDSIPTKVPVDADPEDVAVQNHFAVTALHNKLASGRNKEVVGGLRPLKNPRHTFPTASNLIHNANHPRYNVVLGRDKYLPDDLEVTRRNEQIIQQHNLVDKMLEEAHKPVKIPLTTLLRGRYANSKIYEPKASLRNRRDRISSDNLLQDADNTIGTRKLEVNVMSDTLMNALENNGIYLSRDARADEKSVEFFTACGYNIRKAFSSILKDVLAAHRELLSLIERSGKNSEGDVLEDLFTAFVSHRDQIPMEALQACWTALEQNTAGIASAVNAREEEYGYIIQTLSYVFTLEASQIQALHVSGVVELEPKAAVKTGNSQARRHRSQSVGHALLDAQYRENAMESGNPARRLAVRTDRKAFHLASAFVLLSKIGEALQKCNPFVAEVAVEDYFLPAALPSLIQCSRAGIVEAVARVIVASCMGPRLSEEDDEDEEKQALARGRLEKLVTFMEYVVQPLVINGGSNVGNNVFLKPTPNRQIAQNRQRYYLLLYHVMRQTAETCLMSVELSLESQTEVQENPLIRLATETAARCFSSEHSATRAMGVASTLMLLLWDCWVPVAGMVKEFILRPALEASSSGFLTSVAGDWEGRILTLDLICMLFKKISLILTDENANAEYVEGQQTLGLYVRDAFPFPQLDRAAARYLRTFAFAPLPQRQLALTVVGQHLLPDCHPLLARTWLHIVSSVPSERLQGLLLSEEDHPLHMRTPPADAMKTGPGISVINNTSLRPGSSGGSSSISFILGQVEPTYSLLPLNQTWDTYSVVHAVLFFLPKMEPQKALAIIAAAIMSPQEEHNQVSALMRNFQFAPEWCVSDEAAMQADSYSHEESLQMDTDCNVTLRELVLSSTARGVDPFLESNKKSDSQFLNSRSRLTDYSDDDDENFSEEDSTTGSVDRQPLDGSRVSKAFWYSTLQRLGEVITSQLSGLEGEESKTYDDLTLPEQLASAVLLSLYYRYVKGDLRLMPNPTTVSDINEGLHWLRQQSLGW